MKGFEHDNLYDVLIAGGGLAGLALAIQLGKAGRHVILCEKEEYPFHRVCGEYISNESQPFLENLGFPVKELQLPMINTLMVSSPSGKNLTSKLETGGFGVSRYCLDSALYKIALRNNVTVLEKTKISAIEFANETFSVTTPSGIIQAKVAAGTFGKRSNLDVKWKRAFTLNKSGKLNNFIGVKYHIKTNQPQGLIALHNFSNGYCGISQIEEDKYCLCYMTTAQNLKRYDFSIKQMEEKVLQKNPFLKNIFSTAEFLFKEPLTISQISFKKKSLVENHVLMIGDAAGMITPLCGNGMSMALHASKISFSCITQFLNNSIERKQMESLYIQQWNKAFASRLKAGRLIQSFFGNDKLTNVFVLALKQFPGIVKQLIRATHGKSF